KHPPRVRRAGTNESRSRDPFRSRTVPDALARNEETPRDLESRAAASFDARSSAQSTRGWVPRSSPSLLSLHLWPFHLEPVRCSRVCRPAHAPDRLQLVGIDFEIVE